MKWLEKNWLIVGLVILAYLWYNGSLGNLLGGGAPTSQAAMGGGTQILGG